MKSEEKLKNEVLEEEIVDNRDTEEKANDEVESEAEDKVEEPQDDSEKEELRRELESYKDRFLRTAAEYENFRKRTEREKALIYSDATCMTILSLLPAVDSLELAIKSSEGSDEGYKKGLAMVKNQFDNALKKLGVEAFGEPGEEFNPSIHNAVSHIDDESGEENVISEVFQKGYKKGDRIVRHAMVQVKN